MSPPSFCIHKHWAKRHHFDLRLAMGDVAKSWAVPKQPPTRAGIRRLGIQVEDHPVSYMKFEGTIAEGQYGAGRVRIWDKGTYTLVKHEPGKIVFQLSGKKLKGPYALIRLNRREKQWLFFRRKRG